ncbi:MAG: VWA domain-containing protein, partial [Planctomycetes bacterium]|nr:VWA domain-containing protein [Planctomycetota bacterium]
QPDALASVDGRVLHTRGVGGGGGGAGGNLNRRVLLRANPGLDPRRLKIGQPITIAAVSIAADDELQIFDPATSKPLNDVTMGLDDLKTLGYVSVGESTTESFSPIVENAYIRPLGEAALSTFSIDVDTAAYSIVRRCLVEQNRLPPPGALRIEELVNYFPYSYAGPAGPDPFSVHVDAASCPWNPAHRLVRIVLQGRRVEEPERPAANLVFLLDVSGSMNQPNKLPLVKQSLSMLTERLSPRDRVAMVVYAGASGLALPSTTGDHKAEILGALERLQAGGSTNGAAGIEQAYQVATENFVRGGINRVVLATDGDFNVGVSDPSALVKLIEDKAKSGVFLTALGYGMDNLKDSTLEQLADKGNGNYGYIDTVNEAKKVLVDQGMGTLHAIAKDVKIQVEFNPARVAAFRLLGYENRVLSAQDFADDRKDAGEIGAGHTVTAFYEVVPAGEAVPGAPVDALRYQRLTESSGSGESLVVKLRWKEPEGTVSSLREVPFLDAGLRFDAADPDFRFGAAVAAFGMVLRDSDHKGDATLGLVREIASGALSDDPGGWRGEFLGLLDRAANLKK